MATEWPVIEVPTVSVAVMVCEPAVIRVTANVPTPLGRIEFAGFTAPPSELVIFTVPV